ncbi:uncharacterized protein BCR38DRAFT_80514 [Pseudomassariella vexata]|uniref:Secreted protein n=1 Tax=Pseudomassariella vexata TaxID=1141098 RepID=A0A1Y2DGJ0_9PEZI|nr:uncharacterized protein BCR38DRAFT_80514 [Pseudomassariella vexata]ORY57805.1 hypothetical protein BCR38DRAFT_80514 [Pseudomassariella vexata]
MRTVKARPYFLVAMATTALTCRQVIGYCEQTDMSKNSEAREPAAVARAMLRKILHVMRPGLLLPQGHPSRIGHNERYQMREGNALPKSSSRHEGQLEAGRCIVFNYY